MIARGEFSIAVAGLTVSSELEPELGPLAVSYVFLLAVAGPIAARIAEPASDAVVRGFGRRSSKTRKEAA